eukprot:gene3335-8264_t
MDDSDTLLNMFMALGTTDHSALVDQFKQVAKIDDDSIASFFLEANNWNLQGAVWSYYEQGASSQIFVREQQPSAELAADLTTTESGLLSPGQSFTKTWRLRNTGTCQWPTTSVLRFLEGAQMNAPCEVPVPCIGPGEVTDVSVTFLAPTEIGQHVASWRLKHSDGVTEFFGDNIWVIVNVSEEGTLDIAAALQSTSFAGND